MTFQLKRDDCRAGCKKGIHFWFMATILLIFTLMPSRTYSAYGFVSVARGSNVSRKWYCADFKSVTATTSTTLCMGRKLTIRIVGRKQGGEEWLEEACDMYLKRLKPTGFEVCTEWYKSNDALLKVHNEQASSQAPTKHVPIVLLDPTGLRCTSEALTDKIYQWLQEGGSRLVFVIGGGKQHLNCSIDAVEDILNLYTDLVTFPEHKTNSGWLTH
jgi:23S rRNA pseudoU1915 N3-methylase RlmH